MGPFRVPCARYGGLIKAAVECGRLDLSRTLLRKSGTMDIQNYMSLFRACGRERNSKKALDLLTELEQSAVGVDTTASRKTELSDSAGVPAKDGFAPCGTGGGNASDRVWTCCTLLRGKR